LTKAAFLIAIAIGVFCLSISIWQPKLRCQTFEIETYQLYRKAAEANRLGRRMDVQRSQAHDAVGADISAVILRSEGRLVILSQEAAGSAEQRIRTKGIYSEVQAYHYRRAAKRGCEPVDFRGKDDVWSRDYATQGVQSAILCALKPEGDDAEPIGVLAIGFFNADKADSFESLFNKLSVYRRRIYDTLSEIVKNV